MDFLNLPLEIIETIFLKLDTQALAACALVDERLEKLVYSRHFLDRYCRETFGCSWLNAQDVHDVDIAVPYKFWFWVYETVKAQDLQHGPIIFQSKYLSKIGTLKHLFLMWLMCGHRSSFIDSHALMNVLYPLPLTVYHIFDEQNKFPGPVVIDTLMKIFFSLPEIMHISCSSLKVFSMQKGSVSSSPMQFIFRTRLQPKLPNNFVPIYSVEMLSTSVSARTPALIILIGKENWIFWFGTVHFSSQQPDNLDYLYFGIFNHSVRVEDLKLDVKSALKHLTDCVKGSRDGIPSEPVMKSLQCPIISFENSDIAYMTILLAQESFRTLQRKFQTVLEKTCTNLVRSIQQISGKQDNEQIMKLLNTRASQNNQIDEFIRHLIKLDDLTARVSPYHQIEFVVFKCILERIAFLFRNEIHKSLVGHFSHAFLCDCLGLCFPQRLGGSTHVMIEKCLSSKLKDGLYSPDMWPPHVLSAACLAIPALAEVLRSDILLMEMGRVKCALSTSAINQLHHKLRMSGLTLTNRPPGKPRCPPVLKQVRLLTVDSLGQDTKVDLS